MREHFSNTFQRAERISQEGSLLLEVEGRGKKTWVMTFLDSSFNFKNEVFQNEQRVARISIIIVIVMVANVQASMKRYVQS